MDALIELILFNNKPQVFRGKLYSFVWWVSVAILLLVIASANGSHGQSTAFPNFKVSSNISLLNHTTDSEFNQKFYSLSLQTNTDWSQGVYLTTTQSTQFERDDTQLTVGGFTPLFGRLSGSVSLTHSSTSNIVAENGFYGRVDYALTKYWRLHSSVNYQKYTSSTFSTYGLGLQRRTSSYGLNNTVNFHQLENSSSTLSYSGSYTINIGSNSYTTFNLSLGKQPEEISGGTLETNQFFSFSINGSGRIYEGSRKHPGGVNITYGLSYVDIDTLYESIGANTGIVITF